MRMTQNKTRVLQALAFIDSFENLYPPHSAARVQRILAEDLEYGWFDIANLTRTLKGLADEGLVRCRTASVDVSGETGCIDRGYSQNRKEYWPASLDLEAMILKYKGTPEEQELKWHNAFQRIGGLPQLTMEEFRLYTKKRQRHSSSSE